MVEEGRGLETQYEGVSWEKAIEGFLSAASKRYAHYFPYDMMESVVAMDICNRLVEYKRHSEVPMNDIHTGLRMAKEWAGEKAKYEQSV